MFMLYGKLFAFDEAFGSMDGPTTIIYIPQAVSYSLSYWMIYSLGKRAPVFDRDNSINSNEYPGSSTSSRSNLYI